MQTLHRSRGSSGTFKQAVCRSDEFLSCAKTSWKLRQQEIFNRQQQQRDPSNKIPPPPPKNPTLSLASLERMPSSLVVLEDSLTLLRAIEYGIKQMQSLVRRRGHTNDPAQEIGAIDVQLEQDFKELEESYCKPILDIRRKKQQQRHWELVVLWLREVALHHHKQLQDCKKLRANILTDQTQKRNKFVESNSSNKNKTNTGSGLGAASASGAATPLFDNPLFTATRPSRNKTSSTKREDRNSNIASQQSTPRRVQPATSNGASNYYREKASSINGVGNRATDSGYNGAYGAAYVGASSGGYAGYGSGGYGSSGMRQRRGGNINVPYTAPMQEQEEEEKIKSQIQMREQKRQTQQRLDDARQAESTLSEVAKLYSKMSTLISHQGETLEKIEDDVECALVDVSAGQEELTKLYSIKKGNRPLIIKTFMILNFLIIFMRGYRDR